MESRVALESCVSSSPLGSIACNPEAGEQGYSLAQYFAIDIFPRQEDSCANDDFRASPSVQNRGSHRLQLFVEGELKDADTVLLDIGSH